MKALVYFYTIKMKNETENRLVQLAKQSPSNRIATEIEKAEFRIALGELEKISRETGYWQHKANLKHKNLKGISNYDKRAIRRYEKLRSQQLDLFEEFLKKYNK